MQNADYSLFGQLYHIQSLIDFFSQLPDTNERLIEVNGPTILNRRLIWRSASGAQLGFC